MDKIERINVGSDRLCSWGIVANDYATDGKQVDFQDLLVNLAKKRAATVEGEIKPLSTRIRARNSLMDDLGSALSVLSNAQTKFKNDDGGDKETDITFSAAEAAALAACGKTGDQAAAGSHKISKAHVEEYVQAVKSKIDSCNNQSQSDMSRLQSLVDKRDQSFSTATDLMTHVSDTRGTLIQNLSM